MLNLACIPAKRPKNQSCSDDGPGAVVGDHRES
jgi:hypothetical protein